MSLWICANEIPQRSRFYYFSKKFDAAAGATLTLKACGDTRYQLYVNDALVSEGPCQGSEYVRYYESVDVTPYLREGENEIVAKVLYLTKHMFISVYRNEQPALWVEGQLTQNGETVELGTDGSWTCFRDDSVGLIGNPGVHNSIPPCEEMYATGDMVPVSIRGMYAPNIGNQCYNIFGIVEPYPMVPRLIPAMETHPARELTVVRRGEGFIELDAGVYTTAKISAAVCAKAGTDIRLIYAECYSIADENGNRYKEHRDNYEHPTAEIGGYCDVFHANGQIQEFHSFWYRSFRFIRIEFDPAAEFELHELTYAPYFYPLDHAGTFECSNERYNQMWEVSRNTLLCCMHEMYVDCPYYEQQQYGMDSGLEMLFTFRLGSDTLMPLQSLTDLAHSQICDGMLQANYPSNATQVIPNFTLYWVLMLRDYLRYTGKVADVKQFMGTMDKALEAFENLRRPEDGLIGTTPYWCYIDWVPGWPAGVPRGGWEGPLTITCMMYATALKAGAEICDTLGRPERAAEYRRRAEEMLVQVNKHCYDEEVGLYRFSPLYPDYGQHTTVWAILSGAVTGEEAAKLVDRTYDGHVPVATCAFSMNYYLFRALEMAGRYNYAPDAFAGWEKMLDLHCTTWCENPDSPRSECHAWSSAPAYEFSGMVLGVYPVGDGYSKVRIKPYINDLGLTWAKGTVPTPYGVISVAWEKADGTWSMNVELPEGADMDVTVELPDGQVASMNTAKATYTCKI